MGERGVRNAEVAGSSPAISTNSLPQAKDHTLNDVATVLFLLAGMALMGFAGTRPPASGRPLIGVAGLISFSAGIVIAVA